jgi:penicillin-binding protein 1A
MWDMPKPRRKWYQKKRFLIPLYGTAIFLVIAICGGIWVYSQYSHWRNRARAEFKFDAAHEMESASVVLDKNGKLMGRIFTQNRDRVPLKDLAPVLREAVSAAEDARFLEHKGVDYYGVIRAQVRNTQAGKTIQGASTLTQQLARNTYPEQLPPEDRTKERKLLEMAVALELESRLTKDEIMELYLNRIFFGSGFWGAEAAAKGYFGKRAKDLTLSEAATMAGLIRSPSKLSPWKNRAACMEARNFVLRRMLELKKITADEYEAAIATEPIFKNRRTIHQDSYPSDMVFQQVEKLVGKEAAVSEGYRIYTTIDLELQTTAEQTLRNQLLAVERRKGYSHPTYAQHEARFRDGQGRPILNAEGEKPPPEYLQGAVVMLDNKTGAILALVGGRDFQHSEFNRALYAPCLAGTAFTPLVFAAGFEKGLFPGTLLSDTPLDNRQVMIGGEKGVLGEWGAERADNTYEGPISARAALYKGKNGATVRFGMMTGIDKVLALAKEAGISNTLAAYNRTFLGGTEVRPVDLTLAYTMFPNGGKRPVKPFVISRIEDKSGKIVFRAEPELVEVVSPQTAYEVHLGLTDVLDRGTAERAYRELGIKRVPLAGKTGTAYDFTDVWFVGYSSEVTCSVWAGFDKGRQPIDRGAFSNEVALPAWSELMRSTFENYKPREFQRPRGLIQVEVCAHSGELGTEKCRDGENGPRTTYFEVATEAQAPKQPCPIHNAGSLPPGIPGGPAYKPVDGVARAAVVLPSSLTVVKMKEPAVLGQDPFNSGQAAQTAAILSSLTNQAAPLSTKQLADLQNTAPVGAGPAAAPVRPAVPKVASPQMESNVKLPVPAPMRFE